jgi:glycosyltransferase involved in cell wall biosynthesis
LNEQVGDAGILVRETSASDLADAIGAVLADPVLHDELRRRGLLRARLHSWDECATRTMRVLERVASGEPLGELAVSHPT